MPPTRRSDMLAITRRRFGSLAAAAAGAGLLPQSGRTAEPSISHGTSAFGDLKYGAGFEHFDYAIPDAPKGGYISTGYGPATFDSFNPFILKGTPAIGLGQIYDSLMTSARDEADAMYGLIAETIELPEDRSFAIFNMRPEAQFHDGTPITAADVVFTFNVLVEKGHPTYRTLLAPVTSVSAEGDHRVRFDFAEGVATRDLPMLVAGISILSKAYYGAHDFTVGDLTMPLGNGAYRIGRFDAGNSVTYSRVADYWAADLPVNRGRFNFDEITIDFYRDRSAVLESLKSGGISFNEEFYSKLWATSYDFPAIKRGDVIKETIPDNSPSGTQGFWFNLRRQKFQDARVRQAIGLAFDFEWSNEKLFYGLYQRTVSFFQGGPMMAEGPPTPGELAILERFADKLPEGILSEPGVVPPVTDGSGRLRRELRTAGRLLDEAGWTVLDGRRMKDGQPLEIEILVGGEGFTRIATPFAENLARIGVKADIREIDPTQYKKRLDDYDFDLTTDRKVMSLTPGIELRDYFSSASADQQGSENLAGIKDPVVDALLDIIERSQDREQLTSAVKALDRVLRAMHIWVPQWNKASHNIAYWDLYQRPPVKPDYDRGVFDLWWFDPEKEAKLKAAGSL